MKTAGRENPNHGVAVPRNRAHGAVGQNRSCSIKWAAKQEKVRPWEGCFFLTSTFIELIGTWLAIYVRCQWEPSVERFRPSAIVHTVNLDIRPLRFPPT